MELGQHACFTREKMGGLKRMNGGQGTGNKKVSGVEGLNKNEQCREVKFRDKKANDEDKQVRVRSYKSGLLCEFCYL